MQTVVPFIVAAAVVIVITTVAERFGTRIGGLVGTLPSAITVAYVFIGLTQGVDFASRAIVVVPAEMGINILFLFVFAMLAKRGGIIALAGSLLWWAVASFVLYIVGVPSIWASMVVFVAAYAIAFGVLERVKKTESVAGRRMTYSKRKIASRGILAGTVVMIAVLLSNVGEVISGLFSVFPAIFLSTMIICVLDHDEKFAAGMAKSMVFGSFTVATFAVSLHYLFPMLGLLFGTLGSLCLSACMAFFLFVLRGVME